MDCKRGQISTEYMIIAGFVIFLVIGVLGVGLFYSSLINDRIRIDQIENYANKLTSTAESVFYYGEPSKVTLNVYLPSGVEFIEIAQNNIVMNVSTSSGKEVRAFASRVPIEGSLTSREGVKVIEVIALDNTVRFVEK